MLRGHRPQFRDENNKPAKNLSLFFVVAYARDVKQLLFVLGSKYPTRKLREELLNIDVGYVGDCL